jgi:HicB family
MKTTVAIPDELHRKIKNWAAKDGVSINSWMESALAREEFRRRCIAHGEWLDANPDIKREYEQGGVAAELDLEDAEPTSNGNAA